MKLVVAPAALGELRDTAAFYTLNSNVGLGLAFVAEFERTADIILANPLLVAVFRGPRRRYILRRFPYSVIYQFTRPSFEFLPWRITGGVPAIGRIENSALLKQSIPCG